MSTKNTASKTDATDQEAFYAEIAEIYKAANERADTINQLGQEAYDEAISEGKTPAEGREAKRAVCSTLYKSLLSSFEAHPVVVDIVIDKYLIDCFDMDVVDALEVDRPLPKPIVLKLVDLLRRHGQKNLDFTDHIAKLVRNKMNPDSLDVELIPEDGYPQGRRDLGTYNYTVATIAQYSPYWFLVEDFPPEFLFESAQKLILQSSSTSPKLLEQWRKSEYVEDGAKIELCAALLIDEVLIIPEMNTLETRLNYGLQLSRQWDQEFSNMLQIARSVDGDYDSAKVKLELFIKDFPIEDLTA